MEKETILVVDDESANLAALNKILSGSYQVRIANSGERALQVVSIEPLPQLILLDVMMYPMDGYAVLSRLKENPVTAGIPVIFVTSKDASEDEEQGLSLGAVDYITKPIRPSIVLARAKTHLELKMARDFLHDQNTFLEKEVDRRMKENQLIQNISIRALAHLAEIRDPETGDHILRTQSYIKTLATSLKQHPRYSETMTDRYIQLLTRSAPLHDIGKVGIPDHILLKPGPLTPDEWVVMRTHSVLGARAIEQAEKDVNESVDFLTLAKEIAHWHHERWDGEGYPDGLAGDAIPISARLMALADVFDAIISPRVYKPALSYEKARDIIVEEKGGHFDPEMTEAFMANFEAFVEIADKYQASS